MTGAVTFFVPGRPFSKKRARSGMGRTYTPAETVAAEAAVRHYAKRAFAAAGVARFEGPVALECRFVFERAARSKAVPGVRHVQKPDLDNLEKLVMDALNPHADWDGAWKDDSQVALKYGVKVWASAKQPEGTTVWISALPA